MTAPKRVFITGASSGIGYALALKFASAGDDVAVTARREDRLLELQSQVEALPTPHGRLLPLVADVREADSVRDATRRMVEVFGGIDIVIANAGLGQRGSLTDSAWEDIETLMRTNMDGVLHTIRETVPFMRKQGTGGHILIVSSVVYNLVAPYTASYSASKAFVSSIAASLRFELEPDHIHVTDVLVGRTATEFNQKRLGQAGYASKAPRLPVMSIDYVAEKIFELSHKKKKRVTLRLLDRLIVWANMIIPDVIGKRALRQYKTD